MADESYKINIIPNGTELVIRTGEAEVLHDPVVFQESGIITSPADFKEQRNAEINEAGSYIEKYRAVVIANYSDRSIVLDADPEDELSPQITGKLTLNPYLDAFLINRNKTFSNRELHDHLKFKGPFFASKAEQTELLAKLKKYDVTVTNELADHRDSKGDAMYKKVVQIKHDLKLEFDLNLPIFTGEKAQKIHVDICVDYINGSVQFWLESQDLSDQMILQTVEIMDREIERFKGFAVIKKY